MFEEQTAHVVGWKAMAAMGAAAMLALGGLGVYAGTSPTLLPGKTQNEQMAAALSGTHSEIEQLNTKVNELNSLVAKSCRAASSAGTCGFCGA